MDLFNRMDRIESAQTELCDFLIGMMPVDWLRICFYGEVTDGGDTVSVWMALVEKQTNIICTQEAFWRRYDEYPYEETEATDRLCDLTGLLWKAYAKKFGKRKTWCSYYLSISEDHTFHADLGYELPKGDLIQKHDAVFRSFFNCRYVDYIYKYPLNNIQGAKKLLGEYLVGLIPVEWSRICFAGEVKVGSEAVSTWMALVEKETGKICPQEAFWQRYESYPVDEAEASEKLKELALTLHRAYIETFGETKLWRTYYISISDNLSLSASRGPEIPKGEWEKNRHVIFYKKFFDRDYELPEGKYPYKT